MKAISAVILGFVLLPAYAWAAEIFVSPGGDDVKNLEAARDAVRNLHPLGEPITVSLRGGTYRITRTFELDERDSGDARTPVTWRAVPGETVRLSGAVIIDPKTFEPVTDAAVLNRLPPESRQQVMQVDLKKLGITDFGKMEARGFGQPDRVAPMELFFNDRPMQVARWPNDGFATYGAIIDPGSAPRLRDPMLEPNEQKIEPDRPGVFVYEGDRPSRWIKANDAWLFGYWKYDWADETIKIAKIDPAKHQIALAAPHYYGLDPNKRFYALNLLEELDAPGEYFIDRDAGILYFWPPAALANARITVSTLTQPILAIENAHHITFRDIIFEDMRGYAIFIAGGHDNLIDRCTIRNTGQLGAMIGEGPNGRQLSDNSWASSSKIYNDTAWNRSAGTNNGVFGCIIYNTGGVGVSISGGDRKTLAAARNFAVENDIHDVGRLAVQNHPAISVDGVGNRVAHNFLHDCLHTAIMFSGNDHIFEFNEIARCVTDSNDAGAIYDGRDPSNRGNIIRFNYFHDIGPRDQRAIGAFSVYFDDGISGQLIFGNVFVRAGMNATIFMNGGYDNVIENNIFLACPKAVSYANWGNAEWNRYAHSKLITQRITQSVDIRKPPYSTKYPQLTSVLDDRPDVKRENIVRKNYVTTDNAAFVNAMQMDFRLKPDAAVFKEVPGFEAIPFEKMGRGRDSSP